jgi:capsular polysaccharide transport system ATP-binding protein
VRAEPRIDLQRVVMFESGATVGRSARRRLVIDDVTLSIPRERYIMVGDEADRRCIIDMITGRREPLHGRISRRGRCSYPIGRTAPFAAPVTGGDMVHFMAGVYHFDAKQALDRLRTVLPWRSVLDTRLDRASAAQRLALSIAMAEFLTTDIVLLDGVLTNPDFPDTFLIHIGDMLPRQMAGRLVIMSSRQTNILQPLATRSLIISGGKLSISDQIVHTPLRSQTTAAEPEPKVIDVDLDDAII